VKYKNLLIAPIALLGLAAAMPAAADVNLSIRVGEPTFFGRIDIAGAPPPMLLMPKPVIIEPPAVQVDMEPLYLRVRPEESRNWRRYCRRYDACGRRVYFVRDSWYRDVYVPHYHSHHEDFERRENERMEHERQERERWREHEEHERWREHEDRERDRREERHEDGHDRREERRDDRRDDHHDRDHDHHDDDRDHDRH